MPIRRDLPLELALAAGVSLLPLSASVAVVVACSSLFLAPFVRTFLPKHRLVILEDRLTTLEDTFLSNFYDGHLLDHASARMIQLDILRFALFLAFHWVPRC
jgi:hypothetical protein